MCNTSYCAVLHFSVTIKNANCLLMGNSKRFIHSRILRGVNSFIMFKVNIELALDSGVGVTAGKDSVTTSSELTLAAG